MKDKKYNFVYKTTNMINGMFYYGVHSTDDLDDGYLGSGLFLRREIKRCGKQNFKREIVKMFDTKDQAYKYEYELVNEEMIKNPLCYNMSVGGCGGKLREDICYKKGDDYKRKLSEGAKRFYESEEGNRRKEQIKKERKLYWESEEGQKMKRWISEYKKQFYTTEKGKQVIKQILESRKNYRRSSETIEKQRKSIKKFWDSERGKQIRKSYSEKYSGCNSVTWNTGSRYDVIDTIENKIILEDNTLREIESYFKVTVFPNSYIKHNMLYKKRFKFVARSSHK